MKINKQNILSVIFCILAGLILMCGIVTFIACYKNIAAQLMQGASVKGNELAILNIYISNCSSYVVHSALLFFCGWVARQFHFMREMKKTTPTLPAPVENEAILESDEDFLSWATSAN